MADKKEGNMAIWDEVKQPPKSALKNIIGGRLKGMTDINPQWRYEALTNLFGPVGVGWGYEITRTWTEPAPENQVMCFAEIKLWYDWKDDKSEDIPGIGGSMLIAKERNGLHVSDEGFKMAVTDAISVACKALGLGADVYAGRWDGSKYTTPPDASTPKQEKIFKAQVVTIGNLLERTKSDIDKFLEWVGVEKVEDIPASEFSRIYEALKAKEAKNAFKLNGGSDDNR